MSEFGHSTIPEAVEFAMRRGIPVMEDLSSQPPSVKPGMVKRGPAGSFEEHMTDIGADYLFSQLDYFEQRDGEEPNVRASRMIATVLAGKRTALAYWTQAAPTKRIEVHQGTGSLAVGNPADGSLRSFQLDPEITPRLTLPPGRFYTLGAHPWTPEPLVASGFYEAETPVDWDEMEIFFEPGLETLETPDGNLEVPRGFHDMFRRYAV